MTVFDAEATRQTIQAALPGEFSTYGEPPNARNLYIPPGHAQALSSNHALVVGIRGSGKSVWWSALQSADHRQVVAAALPDLALTEVVKVDAGFGEQNRPCDYPDKRTLGKLLKEDRTPTEIWRTVIACQTWGKNNTSALAGLSSWSEKSQWMEDNPEGAAHGFKRYDDELAERRQKHLVLFDAIDRAADQWSDLRTLLRGLLETLLEFRSYRSIRAKAFVRPDMLNDPAVVTFPDASKIVATKVELRWTRTDLYGLLFQHLANEPQGGGAFRHGCQELSGAHWTESGDIWLVPKPLRQDSGLQRQVFDEIAGKWMGRDRRRGFPYTWLANHLADAADQVSPRSFLAAVRTAATGHVPPDWGHALHYEGIKKGVQEASRVRVDEVREDFFWVTTVMQPLEGLVIPCAFSEIKRRWRTELLEKVRGLAEESGQLLPKRIKEGPAGLKSDLLDLGVFSLQPDGRINMPDVYRLGFGLGRRGGVKPIR